MSSAKHVPAVLCAVVLSLVGSSSAEVAVAAREGTNVVVAGPYVMSIIDTADPIGMWQQHTQFSGTVEVLNASGGINGDGRPGMAMHAGTGVAIVVWGKNVGSSYDLVESRFENGGWTTPAVITAGVSSSADPEPAIAIDKQTGNVHVVYLTNDSNPQVMHVQAPWDLSSWNPPVQVSEIGENAIRPTAVIHQGVLTVAYESHVSGIGNTPRVITVATADGLGGFTHETLTSSHGSSPNRPQLHTGVGNALWVDWIDGTNEMAWSKWNSATGWGPVQLEPFTDIEDREYHVRGRVRKKATE